MWSADLEIAGSVGHRRIIRLRRLAGGSASHQEQLRRECNVLVLRLAEVI